MQTKYVLTLFLALLYCNQALGSQSITYYSKNGINWILPKKPIEFNISIEGKSNREQCEKLLGEIENAWHIQTCKEDIEMCSIETARLSGQKWAFGPRYTSSGIVSKTAEQLWNLQGTTSANLDPHQLEAYADILGIDPYKSVVKMYDFDSIQLNEGYAPRFAKGSESEFFQQTIKIASTSDEKNLYVRLDNDTGDILLTSQILNCELISGKSRNIDVSAKSEAIGIRQLSEDHANTIFETYEELKIQQSKFPASWDSHTRALYFGFLMAPLLNQKVVSQIGFKSITSKLFNSNGSEITLHNFRNIEDLSSHFKVVLKDDTDQTYVRLQVRK